MFKHSGITYNPLQQESYRHVDEDSNIVVMAKTSAGKTIVAEQFLQPCLENGDKAIYLSPLKALTNEKLNDWSDKVESIVAVTSDHMTTPKPITESLILMTTEALDSKTRGRQNWISKVGVIVCDESHLLASEGRGDAFEVGLTRFAEINPDARIIFMSATIPNTNDFAEWLTRLNGKPTRIVQTDWTPVEQEYYLKEVSDYHWDFIDECVSEIVRLRKKYKDKQFLIFVHTINIGNTISKRLRCPFHYSKISMEERHRLETAFRDKSIRTLVATSTLAYGLNLPADVGVIVGGHRGPSMVDPSDLKQEAGRIGRYGLSEKGYVHFLFCKKYAQEVYETVVQTPDIISVLPSRLYFHITSFVAREDMQLEEIDNFLKKTLANTQLGLDSSSAIDLLKSYGILYETDGVLRASKVGRGAALMYMDPIDLYHMKKGLEEKPLTPTGIAIAISNIPSLQRPGYLPKDLKDPVELGYPQATVQATCIRDWLMGKSMDGIRSVIVPPVVKDFDRVASALKIAGVEKSYTESISLMVKNGIHSYLLELVKLPGIGRKRALDLYAQGIKSPEDITANPRLSQNILGQKLYRDLEASITTPGKVILRF